MATAASLMGDGRHWGRALFVIIIGAFMAILDTSIVNIAISTLESEFSVSTSQVQWVVTVYLLALGVVVPMAAYLGDRFGLKRVYLAALTIFTIGSALSGLSWSLGALIFFRILQALGGGLIMPVTMSMLYQMVPRDRIGTAMGIWGLTLLFAPALGPTLGGYLVQFITWRLIFYINVPIGILGILLGIAYVPDFPVRKGARFDPVGFVLVAAGLFGLLLALSEGQTWGWSSETIVLLLVGSGFLLLLFTEWELTIPHPLLNLRVFRYGSFTLSNLLSIIITMGLFSGVFYVPLFLQTVAGYGAFRTGLILMPGALASGLMMPIAGRIYDKIGVRLLGTVGLLLLGYTTYLLHNLSPTTPAGTVTWWMVWRGFGMGMTMMPIMTAGMSPIPTLEVGSASAINNIIQRVAGSFGLAALTAVLDRRVAAHTVNLASPWTPVNPAAQHLLVLFHHLPQGLTLLGGYIQGEAFVFGIDDVFVLMAALTVTAAVLTPFLRTVRHPPGPGGGRRVIVSD
ncbi:MFS transporter [Candidatus Hydrogenisulfobacillus filiaventi]|uniref:MFS transporter n=1 Tax=Candidatus Hydrogenisulfobacillus filiaventi TaxID=2707344 RepID=A0A6F8ZEZ6_9FIRM|nr:MFS transporter [Candidatus Hydrogenisulfobacillus filiaventi]